MNHVGFYVGKKGDCQILLGLIAETSGIGGRILRKYGVTLRLAREEIKRLVGRGSGFVAVEIPFTPRARRVLENAIDESKDPELVATTLDFLVEMQTDEGGLRANTRIPIADLLSSFTGALTLIDLDAFEEIDIASYRRFVESMQRPEGGFQAAAWDTAHDVEYSFYGLGCMALLENH